MLQFKQSVKLDLTSRAIQRLLIVLSTIAKRDSRVYLITSGNDSAHAVNSRHYTNEAIDIRTKTMTKEYKRDLRQRFEAELGPQFRVLLEDEGEENEHMHAQVKKAHVYDPKTDA
jgi:hypothetical protein